MTVSYGFIDELIGYTRTKPGKASERFFAHANYLYSVAAITDAAGNVRERSAYDAYGKCSLTNSVGAALVNSAVGNNAAFTGRSIDTETGLMYFRARMLAPMKGYFINRDPLLYVNGFSTYLSFFIPNSKDPTGKFCCTDVCKWGSTKNIRVDRVLKLPHGFGDPEAYGNLEGVPQKLNTADAVMDIAGIANSAVNGASRLADTFVSSVDAGSENMAQLDNGAMTRGVTNAMEGRAGPGQQIDLFLHLKWDGCAQVRCLIFWEKTDWQEESIWIKLDNSDGGGYLSGPDDGLLADDIDRVFDHNPNEPWTR